MITRIGPHRQACGGVQQDGNAPRRPGSCGSRAPAGGESLARRRSHRSGESISGKSCLAWRNSPVPGLRRRTFPPRAGRRTAATGSSISTRWIRSTASPSCGRERCRAGWSPPPPASLHPQAAGSPPSAPGRKWNPPATSRTVIRALTLIVPSRSRNAVRPLSRNSRADQLADRAGRASCLLIWASVPVVAQLASRSPRGPVMPIVANPSSQPLRCPPTRSPMRRWSRGRQRHRPRGEGAHLAGEHPVEAEVVADRRQRRRVVGQRRGQRPAVRR